MVESDEDGDRALRDEVESCVLGHELNGGR